MGGRGSPLVSTSFGSKPRARFTDLECCYHEWHKKMSLLKLRLIQGKGDELAYKAMQEELNGDNV